MKFLTFIKKTKDIKIQDIDLFIYLKPIAKIPEDLAKHYIELKNSITQKKESNIKKVLEKMSKDGII